MCAEDNYLPAKQHPKSLYVSRTVSYFYETDFEFWAGFGLVRNTNNICNYSYNSIKRICSIKRPGLEFSKKSLLNDQYDLKNKVLNNQIVLFLLNVLV